MGVDIGIDFGTTNTILTYTDREGRLRQIRHENHEIIPSALFYRTRDEYFCGFKALGMRKRYPEAAVVAFKSRLGEPAYALEIQPQNDRKFRQVARSALNIYLNRIFQSAEDQLLNEFGPDGLISRVVVTVPAKFNPVERTIIQEAVREATMKALGTGVRSDVRIALEPTAAAIAAMHEAGENGPDSLLVYDFGGGTFDISLIQRRRGVFHQVITEGDRNLGGNDLSKKIAAAMLERINEEYGCELPLDPMEFDEETCGISRLDYDRNMDAIAIAANSLKEDMSDKEEATFSCSLTLADYPDALYVISVAKEEIEELIRPEIERTVELVARVLDSPEARAAGSVDTLILAGGSSQIPLVARLLKERFPAMEVVRSRNASRLISCGAALLAQRIDEIDNITEQATTMAIGVATTKGIHFNKFETLIPVGSPLPAQGSKEFQLARDGQESLDIRYYEHDAKQYPDASTITDDGIEEVDRLLVSLPPGLLREETLVALTFMINKDGSMDIMAEIRDRDGKTLESHQALVRKESDLQ